MEVDRYLERIGYGGPVAPDFETLRALQRAHLLTIPYENLDIHRGVPLVVGAERAFAKIVDGHRGGWCYEMNGLFGSVLERIGFRVRRVAGTVGHADGSTGLEGGHLVLVVDLGQWVVAEVGFGDGPLDPLPLAEGSYPVGDLGFRISRAADRWTVHNHEKGGAAWFSFTLEARELEWFAPQCHALQTDPGSGFVQKAIVQRYRGEEIHTLRGAVYRVLSGGVATERVLDNARDYDAILRDRFDLAIPDPDRLWDGVWRRHLEWRRGLGAT